MGGHTARGEFGSSREALIEFLKQDEELKKLGLFLERVNITTMNQFYPRSSPVAYELFARWVK